jgi:glutamine synthetase
MLATRLMLDSGQSIYVKESASKAADMVCKGVAFVAFTSPVETKETVWVACDRVVSVQEAWWLR